MEQFNNEYEKACTHFASAYCKKTFTPYTKEHFIIKGGGKQTKYATEWVFLLEYILALMIYCNYTDFSAQFSKTYRINNGKQHNEFYYLAKYLKIAVQQFGTETRDGSIDAFYHGIGEQLIFPKFIGGSGIGVSVQCPLSTSSSFIVAVNFTNHNNGLVVQFGFVEKAMSKYFSVSWLSDYPNESEYLFVQNYGYLKMDNLFDVKYGYEYEIVLQALEFINNMISPKQPMWRPLDITLYPKLKLMITRILKGQLAKRLESAIVSKKSKEEITDCPGKHGLEKFKTEESGYGCSVCSDYGFPKGTLLYGCRKCDYDVCVECMDWIQGTSIATKIVISEYAKQIVNTYFNNQDKIFLNYVDFTQKSDGTTKMYINENKTIRYPHSDKTLYCPYSFIFDLFFHSDHEWIKMEKIGALFPNIKIICVDGIDFDGDSCLSFLYKFDLLLHLEKIVIRPNRTIQRVVDRSTTLFRKVSMFISGNLTENRLYIEKCDQYKFVLTLIDKMGSRYFCEKDVETVKLLDRLVKNELSNNININDSEQHAFHEYCIKKNTICIEEWNNDYQTYLFKLFFHTRFEWINMDIINKLFPNLKRLSIGEIKLCSLTLDKILNHLKKNKQSNLEIVELLNIKKNSALKAVRAVSKYKRKFEKIKFNMIHKVSTLFKQKSEDIKIYSTNFDVEPANVILGEVFTDSLFKQGSAIDTNHQKKIMYYEYGMSYT